MNLHLDTERMRVICDWDEPRQVIMNKLSRTVAKRRSLSVRITRRGRVNRRDMERVDGHPKLPVMLSFIEAMKRQNLLPVQDVSVRICEVCGRTERVFPHFDRDKRRIVWLCGEHRHHLESRGQAQA
jgi:hypothetical protein